MCPTIAHRCSQLHQRAKGSLIRDPAFNRDPPSLSFILVPFLSIFHPSRCYLAFLLFFIRIIFLFLGKFSILITFFFNFLLYQFCSFYFATFRFK